ncbi:alpha-(1,6)-fucosyltransferase-like [Mercenaria mercenaria]|uniref:alpha-(1,6)-fucosyltransferase-like n=1 Tax=Mercenaria mercenaria TaxID=6596 RepID=UPI00234F2E40|nr:alpha-(1,6)-fucosyltransferase-like [Mercenaria mercenaria]
MCTKVRVTDKLNMYIKKNINSNTYCFLCLTAFSGFVIFEFTGFDFLDRHNIQMSPFKSQIEDSSVKGVSRSNAFAVHASRFEISDWRTKELQRLGDLVQRRLYYLQNPKDCENAKKILCKTRKAGFGSQAHDWMFCLIVAYATQRTLIIDSKGWQYSKHGLERVFLPLSTNCRLSKNEKVVRITDLRNMQNTTKVVLLPYNHQVLNRPLYLPHSIPEDLAEQVSRVHKNPSVWWIGQCLTYITRKDKRLKRFIDQNVQKLGSSYPTVGVHVRRTDKEIESKYHDLSEYMTHVEKWFDAYNRRHGTVQRRVYIASDEPSVLSQARESYPNYTFVCNVESAILAKRLDTRFSESSFYGLILDLHMLSTSDFFVCTLSSNTGRLVYELMNVRYWDAPDRIKSLDIEFAFQFKRYNPMYFAQHRNETFYKKFKVVKDISNPWKLSATMDNNATAVRMPTYSEVPILV